METKSKIYVTYDKDAQKYSDRFFQAPNDLVAKRIIRDAQANDKTFKRNAKSYDLFCLGEYDWKIGKIDTACNDLVCNCNELIEED